MSPFKIMAGIVAIAAFLAVAFTFDGRYLHYQVYADEMSIVQKKLNVIEQRRIETAIEDLEDRLDTKSLSPQREAQLKERIKSYNREMKRLGLDNLYIPGKGGSDIK